MFYYYGRKKQLAKHYPHPVCDTIIEPFAGAGSYSLYGENWKKKVILIEKDPSVAAIWKWLIEDAQSEDILKLPILKVGERSTEFLHIIHAVTKMAFHFKRIKVTPVLERNWEISRRYMAENVFKVKHWDLIQGDYTLAPDITATWFIDPPYKGEAGTGYRWGSKEMDYSALANWILARKGQVICCEGHEGDYLPFTNLIDSKGVAGKVNKEKIYYFQTAEVAQRDWGISEGMKYGIEAARLAGKPVEYRSLYKK